MLDLRSAWLLAHFIKHEPACVIHAHNFKEAFTAAYARKIIGRKDVKVVMCRNLTRKGKTSLVYRWLYKQLDCIVFDSQLAMDEFLSTNPPIDRDKLRVIFNAIIVPDNLQAMNLRAEFGIAQDETIILCHGRLDPEKGLDTLLEAVAQIKERHFQLVLVGRGSEEYTAHLKQTVQEKGIADKVVFAGFVHPVLPYVAGADFGILASTVQEGCPLSPQEYMSQGRPVVVTNNGGQREYVVQEQNGLLVPPGDAKALAEAMARLVDDAALRQRLGQQAKADFDDHLNYDHYYEQIKKIYEE